MNNEKLVEELPRVRVTEAMWRDLAQEAANSDRSMSDLIRHVLSGWLYGHVKTVTPTQAEQ